VALGLMMCRVTCVVRRPDGFWDPTTLLTGAVRPGIEWPVRESGHLPSCSDEINP